MPHMSQRSEGVIKSRPPSVPHMSGERFTAPPLSSEVVEQYSPPKSDAAPKKTLSTAPASSANGNDAEEQAPRGPNSVWEAAVATNCGCAAPRGGAGPTPWKIHGDGGYAHPRSNGGGSPAHRNGPQRTIQCHEFPSDTRAPWSCLRHASPHSQGFTDHRRPRRVIGTDSETGVEQNGNMLWYNIV